MAYNRREFLLGSLIFTLGSCANLGKNGKFLSRKISSLNKLSYKLSKEQNELKNYYKAIVIGSGYGASVVASRLATHFGDVCLLERGKEWHPGDFPETPSEFLASIKSPLNRLGLFDIAPGDGVDIVCANGLGGTSLINAAIAIRPEMNVFDLKVWPQAIREAARSGELEKYYLRAESVLKPNKLGAYQFFKSKMHKRTSDHFKVPSGELALNIQPENGQSLFNNIEGFPQGSCVQCGNCCSGCNYGAKNTLVTNYLYQAHQKGVNIFTSCEVVKIEKVGAQYQLTVKLYEKLGTTRFVKIKTDHLFLGAGAKGSTELLLKSEEQNFKFSPALGSRLSANGDVMGLAYNTDYVTGSMGLGPEQVSEGADKVGTIISTYADYRKKVENNNIMNQFLLLDGVIPSAISQTVAGEFANYFLNNEEKFYGHLSRHQRKIKIDRILLDKNESNVKDVGALSHSMLYFACGHDSSSGRFNYDRNNNTVNYSWKNAVNEPTIKRIEKTMSDYAHFLGGTFVENPRMKVFGGNIQATHPLGGCPMGDNYLDAVVDHMGRVYDDKGRLHRNLYVVDASILPHSLAATPLLTITAFAERISDLILQNKF